MVQKAPPPWDEMIVRGRAGSGAPSHGPQRRRVIAYFIVAIMDMDGESGVVIHVRGANGQRN